MSNGNIYKKGWFQWLVVLSLIFIVLVPAGGYQFIASNISRLSTTYTTPPPPPAGANAFCPATNTVAPISSPPPGCFNQAQILQITPQELGGIGGTPFPIGTFEKTTGVGCKIFVGAIGSATPTEFIQASSSGVCPTANTYLPGSQVWVQFCEDDSTGCVTGDYKNTQTVMYCPLPSIVGTGLCNAGSGSGYVPFSTTPSASTAPTQYFYMPIVPLLGDDPVGMNSGTSEALVWTWQNNTQATVVSSSAFISACYVSTGSTKACDLPTATSVGNFYTTLNTIPVGTLPAAPYSIGYASFTPVDPTLQSGTSARGALNYVLTLEVKATTNNDICTLQSSTGFTFAGPFSRGGSSTDQMYYAVIPDSAITKSTDQSGNPIANGNILGQLQWNCNQVYNGSGDIVQICATQWAYFSTKWFATANYNTVNPEAVKVGNAGATPTTNSVDNQGLTCASGTASVVIKT